MALALLGITPAARGQEWVRNHFDQPAAAPASGGLTEASPGLNPVSSRRGRTANFGGLALDLSASTSLEYNDNVRVEPNAQPGLIARGALRLEGQYQLSRLQNIALTTEISDRVPLTGPGRHEQLLAVSPDSALRFNVWVKSLRLSPFLKYRRQLDPSLSPVVNGTEIYAQSAFTSGVQADLPLHESGLQLLVLQENRRQKGESSPAISARSRVLSVRFSRDVMATNRVAVDAAVTRSGFTNGPSSGSTTLSTGLSNDWQISPASGVRLAAGIERRLFRESRTAGDPGKHVTPFFSVGATQKLRENLSFTLGFNRSISEGVSTNFYRTSELSFTPQYRFTRDLSVDFASSWQWIRESGPAGETGTRQRHGGSLAYQLRPDLNLRLAGYHLNKRSDLAARRYIQNTVTLSASLSF